jgi:transmembrane sensor
MSKIKARDLLKKYVEGDCTPAEQQLFEDWYAELNQANRMLLSEEELEQVETELANTLPVISVIKPIKSYKRYLQVAAAVLLISSISLIYLLTNRTRKQLTATHIKSGGNKAFLTLSNGKKIILNDRVNRDIVQQSGIEIVKLASGQLIYKAKPGLENTSDTLYNTVTTPAGGQFQVVLPDSTHVWLNSSSSIRFPLVFGKSSRHVHTSGEAYFEVSHHPERPFLVMSAKQTVTVLGTHFNINAYDNEPSVNTTLLQGSVRLSNSTNAVTIKPGQEAVLNSQSKIFNVHTGDTEKAIAWIHGNFMFNGDNITVIMREISRWYNVDVYYDGPISAKIFTGSISRFSDISKVLNTLELTGIIHFKIEGRRVTVITN